MFEQIESNRRRSAIVIGVMGVLLVATGASLGVLFAPGRGGMLLGALVALILWGVMWAVTVTKGDDIMLRMAGAREIEKDDLPQLVNIVEEMTIAAGLGRRPRVYLVDDPAPNAFATGRDPERAAVAVTKGLLERLDRAELQGVVAHELAHIKNRDVALMTTAGIMLGSIVLLAEVGRRVLWFGGGTMRRARSSNSSDSRGGGQAYLMIVAVLLMILAPLLAQLVYFALSRRREYLADASGAVFTRYPESLASALEKLGASTRPQADTSRVTAPMYIVRPFAAGGRQLASAFSTHPPLEDRIRVLRRMGGQADLRSYERAYREQHGGGALIGKRSLAAGPETTAAMPAFAGTEPSPRQRARAASDAMLHAAGYADRPCQGCGATLKIPPALRARLSRCPRCKTPFA